MTASEKSADQDQPLYYCRLIMVCIVHFLFNIFTAGKNTKIMVLSNLKDKSTLELSMVKGKKIAKKTTSYMCFTLFYKLNKWKDIIF